MFELHINFLAAWFVTPWFLWAGALLASIPIIIHILNRRRFKIVRWAAMEYLLQAMRKNRRRLKFEQWLLLAVRCLLIFLMGMALARPLGCDNSTIAALGGQRTALHVIIIDNSYSMGYEAQRPEAKTHLEQAKKMARRVLDRLNAGNEAVMIITAASPIELGSGLNSQTVTPRPTFDLEAARSAINRIEQTALATDLHGAFQAAIRVAVEEKQQPRKHLYIFTDGTRSAFESKDGKFAEGLRQAGPELARHFGKPHLFVLGKQGQWNQAVLSVGPTSNLVNTKFTSDFSADIRGFGSGPAPLVQWTRENVPVGKVDAVKLDLETQPQSLPGLKFNEGGPQVIGVTLKSPEDRLKVDNTRWRVVDVMSEMRVLIVEGSHGGGRLEGSGAFLELALSPPADADQNQPSGKIRKTNSYIVPEVSYGERELQHRALESFRAIFLTDVKQFDRKQAEMLKKYVELGGTLVIFGGPAVSAEDYNKNLVPLGLLPGNLVKIMSSPDTPYHLDFQPHGNTHPYLKEFRGLEKTGLTTAEVTHYWLMELPVNSPAERVLDFQRTKDPAVVAHSLGKGRVVFFATTANGEWNTLTPKPAYVALMHEIVAGSVGANDRWMNLQAGDYLAVPPSLGLSAAPRLLDPSKNPIVVEAVTDRDGAVYYRSGKPLAQTGIYQLQIGRGSLPIAVNVPGLEADVRLLTPEAIRKAMGDVELAVEDESAALAALRSDSSNDWSWALMAIVLVLAGAECFMAMRFGHYRRTARQVSEPATV